MSETYSVPLEEFIDLLGDMAIAHQKRGVGLWPTPAVTGPAFFLPRCASVFEVRAGNVPLERKLDAYGIALLWPESGVKLWGDSTVSDGVLLAPSPQLIEKTGATFGVTIDFSDRPATGVLVLPRTNWINEVMHRYVYERAQMRRTDSLAATFLEQELVKEFHFRIKECEVRDKSRFDLDARATDLRSPLLREAMAFIEGNLFRDISVEDIVRKAGVSESTLLREFRERLATSPSAYITARRLEEAMLLLKGQIYSVSQVSDIVGYENVSAFSAAFKKQLGLTPTQVITKDPSKLVLRD